MLGIHARCLMVDAQCFNSEGMREIELVCLAAVCALGLVGCANLQTQDVSLGRPYYDYRYGGMVDPFPFGPGE
jgi:hypothetical protein